MNGNGSLEGLSEKAYEIARRRQAASTDLVAMLEEHFETTFGSHAATLLHGAAWLAGGSLRRSFDAQDSTGEKGVQQSDEAMKLMKVFMFLVDKDGAQLKPEDYMAEIPEDQKPRLTIGAVEEQFAQRYDEIMKKHGFDLADGARTGAVTCSKLLKIHCLNRNDLEPKIAASIVSIGFVEGAGNHPKS